MSVAMIAREKKMNPALIAPVCSVYIASEGSIGDTVSPIDRHWTMCTAINRCRRTSAAARHFDVADAAMSVFFGAEPDANTGRLTDLPVRLFFGSQPSFIGVTILENAVTNSVKGMYWFPKPTLQLSFLYQ